MHTIPSPTFEALESLELPTPPGALLAFLQAVRRDDASLDEMAELALREPGLTARNLTGANAAAFDAVGRMRSLKQSLQSLQALGLRTLHSIAACVAVREASPACPGRAPAIWIRQPQLLLAPQAVEHHVRPTDEDRQWFPDIAGKPWLPVLDHAMRNFKDESFIGQYLSPKLMRELRLFAITDDEKQSELHVSANPRRRRLQARARSAEPPVRPGLA